MQSHTGASLSLGFTGELTDPTTGLVDLRARELDPTLGRFLSADTMQPNAPGSQGYNLYAYVANNPTTWTDPSGHGVGTAMSTIEEVEAAAGASAGSAGLLELITAFIVGLSGADVIFLGVVVAVVFLAIIVVIMCMLDDTCRAHDADQAHAIKQYGSAAAAGAWTGGAQATRTAWHELPAAAATGVLCHWCGREHGGDLGPECGGWESRPSQRLLDGGSLGLCHEWWW